MKLIIDIPEETYTQIRDNILFGEDYKSVIWDITGAIVNSIPLEDIKAEIEDLEPDYGNTGYGFESYYKCQSEVLNIIDKHIGGKE